MNKETITFTDNEIEKRKFHRSINTIHLNDVNIDNMLISTENLFW